MTWFIQGNRLNIADLSFSHVVNFVWGESGDVVIDLQGNVTGQPSIVSTISIIGYLYDPENDIEGKLTTSQRRTLREIINMIVIRNKQIDPNIFAASIGLSEWVVSTYNNIKG